MSVTPQARAVIEAMEAAFPPLDTGKSGTQVRAEVKAAADSVIPLDPEPVGKVEQIIVPVDGAEIAVRIYWPARPLSDPAPLVMFFHGGGFVVCDLDSHDDICRSITNTSGCVVASVDYRLAPEHPYPLGVEDCYAATVWMVAHAADFGVDPARVAVVGDSAGGNLAAVVALMCTDRGGPTLTMQVLVYPMIDRTCSTGSHLNTGEGYFLKTEEVQYYWGQYLADPSQGTEPYASPAVLESVVSGPRALVVTAENDPLRDESESYGEMLRRSGIPVRIERFDGMFHSFWSFLTALDEAPKVSA